MDMAKNQHWVPRFYLKYFSIPETRDAENPKVWVFSRDADDPISVGIRNIASKRYLYSPVGLDGTRTWGTEAKLQKLEGLLSRIWPALANDFVDFEGNLALKRIVALFISTLNLRHPENVKETEWVHKSLVKFYEGFPKDQSGKPLIESIEYRDNIYEMDCSDYDSFRDADKEAIKTMFVDNIHWLSVSIAELLLEKRWSVVFSDSPVFITCDRPVAVIHPDKKVFGIRTKGTTILFPLSPTRVLLLDDMLDQPKGQYYPLNKTGAASWNFIVWRNASTFMISHRDIHEVLKEIVDLADASSGSSIEGQWYPNQ